MSLYEAIDCNLVTVSVCLALWDSTTACFCFLHTPTKSNLFHIYFHRFLGPPNILNDSQIFNLLDEGFLLLINIFMTGHTSHHYFLFIFEYSAGSLNVLDPVMFPSLTFGLSTCFSCVFVFNCTVLIRLPLCPANHTAAHAEILCNAQVTRSRPR